MPLNYLNLDARTRGFMLAEIEMDIAADTLYRSPWLTDQGTADWAEMMREAARDGSDATLATAPQPPEKNCV